MPVYGECKICGGETIGYVCVACVCVELDATRETLEAAEDFIDKVFCEASTDPDIGNAQMAAHKEWQERRNELAQICDRNGDT